MLSPITFSEIFIFIVVVVIVVVDVVLVLVVVIVVVVVKAAMIMGGPNQRPPGNIAPHLPGLLSR
jgi:hypothetical protein